MNSLKVPKIMKILLYEMKFLLPNYSCLQNPWLGGYRTQIPLLYVLCPQLNLLNPPPFPEQNSWLHHWLGGMFHWTGCWSKHIADFSLRLETLPLLRLLRGL